MLELEFLRPLPVLGLAPEGHRSDLHLLELVEPSLYLRPLLLGLELLLRAAGEGPYVVQCRLSLERHQCLLEMQSLSFADCFLEELSEA